MLSEAIRHNYVYRSGYLDTPEMGHVVLTKQLLNNNSIQDFSEIFGQPVDVFDTVIISDVHLGSKVSQAEDLLNFLDSVHFKHLIINGDVFDSINMHRLNRIH